MRRPDSVVATDQDALRTLLTLHAVPDPRILDVTANRQVMWKGLPYRPVTNDRDEAMPTDHHHDFRALPQDWTGAFDVLVFDPPHLTENAGAFSDRAVKASGVTWTGQYGTAGEGLGTESIGGLFAPFLEQARRVLAPNSGVVLAKIADQVHRGAYRFQHVELIAAAREAGFTPCDLMLRLSIGTRSNMIDPKWKRIYHVRQVHTYWLVLRNGPKCCAPTAPHVERNETVGMFAGLAAA